MLMEERATKLCQADSALKCMRTFHLRIKSSHFQLLLSVSSMAMASHDA